MNIEAYYNDQYNKKVKTISRILGGDHAAAEDIVQEAFARALTFYPSYDSKRGSVDKWFNSIMFNALKDYQRNDKGIVHNDPEEFSIADVFDLKQTTLVNRINTVLSNAIEKVKNETHRRVLELFFIMGYSSREIPQIERGVSQTNVTTLVMRFKENLRGEGLVI